NWSSSAVASAPRIMPSTRETRVARSPSWATISAGGRAPAQVQAALDQPDQELQFGPRADVRLGVAQHVCCSDAELTSRQVNILVDEHVFPRYEDIVEYDQRIGLVEAAGQRVVEHTAGSERIGSPRVELQAGRAGRHHAGDRVIFVARPQGQ